MYIKFTESHKMFRNKSIAREDFRANRFKLHTPGTRTSESHEVQGVFWHQVKKNKTKCVLKSKS